MWDAVEAELDEWKRERRRAEFWWRDDDAQDVTSALKKLLAVAGDFRVPIALSVIPARFSPALARMVKRHEAVDVLVHGHGHVNHARPGRPKREYGVYRRQGDMEQELLESLALINRGFGSRALPVLVPPWNRIPPTLASRLPGLGYKGLSTWKPRKPHAAPAGLVCINTHLDPIDWRRGRAPKSEHAVAAALLRKLRWRRKYPERALEPLGLLTHHLLWGHEIETTIAHVLALTRSHPAATWVSARSAFGL
jgi:hypothetical protein